MQNVHLIVGLGNPGRRYAHTRHNAGFLAVERLASRLEVRWEPASGFEAQVARAEAGGRRMLLAQPQTFMNLSGRSVAGLAGYYRVELARLLVVVDDADLALGVLRLRGQGSSGGHHGLESIEAQFGSRAYARLRIGIGRPGAAARELTGHVLARFGRGEQELLERVLDRAADQMQCWVAEGLGPAMNRFNGNVQDSEQDVTE
jgi:PTH1 family peptidyl-tRNA hydrolase